MYVTALWTAPAHQPLGPGSSPPRASIWSLLALFVSLHRLQLRNGRKAHLFQAALPLVSAIVLVKVMAWWGPVKNVLVLRK
jgi:hypothetical protein